MLENSGSPLNPVAMADELTPIAHARVRARELLTVQLSIEGVSEAARADADELARQLWSGGTNDVVMSSIQEILPAAAFKELLAFCQREYPLSFTMLPARQNFISRWAASQGSGTYSSQAQGPSEQGFLLECWRPIR